ncbi:uncharacterized protein EAF02_010162 [Botrytis sinoallii]|uniref:uncharacterized protein n=1 Tax=Botrytis sinoallii TaxID=1463999 RepID=UPI0018FF5EEF|nr:uncharacterized protein EAF02_010162 [Botrytis sinoallii]KAF7864194.1 hypothetical protein EAF02_010162 [Botrytis sinoallii]
MASESLNNADVGKARSTPTSSEEAKTSPYHLLGDYRYASPAKNPTLVLQFDDGNKSLRASYTNASSIIKHELAEADDRQ